MGRGAGKFAKEIGLKKGTWSSEEDELLTHFVKLHGEGKWRSLAQKAGLNRSGKSCRLRWLNYLRPGIKRGDFSEDEEELIIKLHRLLGNRWVLIAGRLPGRTDNEIKNYWNTILVKKVQVRSKESENSKLSSMSQFQSDDKKSSSSTVENFSSGELEQIPEQQAGVHNVGFSGGQIHTPENDSLVSSTEVFDVNKVLISDTFNFDSWHEHEKVSELQNGEKITEPLQHMVLKKIASLLDIENELRELLQGENPNKSTS